MPAQAGIHATACVWKVAWVPAFAGMTFEGTLGETRMTDRYAHYKSLKFARRAG